MLNLHCGSNLFIKDNDELQSSNIKQVGIKTLDL